MVEHGAGLQGAEGPGPIPQHLSPQAGDPTQSSNMSSMSARSEPMASLLAELQGGAAALEEDAEAWPQTAVQSRADLRAQLQSAEQRRLGSFVQTLHGNIDTSRSDGASRLVLPVPKEDWLPQSFPDATQQAVRPAFEAQTAVAQDQRWAVSREQVPAIPAPFDLVGSAPTGLRGRQEEELAYQRAVTATQATQSHLRSVEQQTAAHHSALGIGQISSEHTTQQHAHNSHRLGDGTKDFLEAMMHNAKEYNRQGRLALSQNNLVLAEDRFNKAMEIIQEHLPNRSIAALTLNNLGCLYRRQKKPRDAVHAVEKAIKLMAEHPDRQKSSRDYELDIDVADLHLNMATGLSQLKQHEAALAHVESAVSVLYGRLGVSNSQQLDGSRKDPKDLRLLAIAHYNCGAEQQYLHLKSESLKSFQSALDISENFLGPSGANSTLHSTIRKAYARAIKSLDQVIGDHSYPRRASSRSSRSKSSHTTETNMRHGGSRPEMAPPPGVTPLRLSMLQDSKDSSRDRSFADHSLQDEPSTSDFGEPPKHFANTMPEMVIRGHEAPQDISRQSNRSTTSLGSGAHETPSSGRSIVTPHGWHSLHHVPREQSSRDPIHRGKWALSARRSAREDGELDTSDSKPQQETIPELAYRVGSLSSERSRVSRSTSANSRPPIQYADSQIQTTKAGVLSLDNSESSRLGTSRTEGREVALRVSGAADVSKILRDGRPLEKTISAATRYLPRDGPFGGLVDYDGVLNSRGKKAVNASTQVETEYTASDPMKVGTGPKRMDIMQRIEDFIDADARSQRIQMAQFRLSTTESSMNDSSNMTALEKSLDRTYRGHLHRTKMVHQRYNSLASRIQNAYRCHLSRSVTRRLKRNPHHLRSMYINQIHAFASLLQSNVRCMLSRLKVVRKATQKAAGAEERWKQRRFRAAIRIQCWWLIRHRTLVGKKRSNARRRTEAAAILCGAWRCSLARRSTDLRRAEKASGILHYCENLKAQSVQLIQCAIRRHQAKERLRKASEKAIDGFNLHAHMAIHNIYSLGLTGGRLRYALFRQERSAAVMQVFYSNALDRKMARQRKQRKEESRLTLASTRIQCALRSAFARKTVKEAMDKRETTEAFFTSHMAATCIQCALLSNWARRKLSFLRDKAVWEIQNQAAVDIRRVYCGHLARNQVRQKIQNLQVKEYLERRKDELTVRLQMATRCWIARRKTLAVWQERTVDVATVKLQCAARQWLARNELSVYADAFYKQSFHSAALAVQYWSFANPTARKRPLDRWWRNRRNRAVTVVANAYRCHVARRQVFTGLANKVAEHSALQVQRVVRGFFSRNFFRIKWTETAAIRRQRAALKIQLAIRSKIARVEMETEKMAYLERWQFQQEELLQRKYVATKLLQARMRMLLVRRTVLGPMQQEQQEKARRLLQRVALGHVGRKAWRDRLLLVQEAAVRGLQSSCRMLLARKMARLMMDLAAMVPELHVRQQQLEAASKIQRAYFMHLARLDFWATAGHRLLAKIRRAYAMQAYRRRRAVSYIEYTFLAHSANQFHRSNVASLYVTAAVKRKLFNDSYRAGLAAQTICAAVRQTLINTAYRRSLAALRINRIARMKLIQSAYRKELAGATISAASIGSLTRLRYSQKLAADTITAAAGRYCRRRYHLRKLAMKLLEGKIKARLTRRLGSVSGIAATRLQSVVRGHMDRKWTRANRKRLLEDRWKISCTVYLQAVYRGHLARRFASDSRDLLLKEAASYVLQAATRRGLYRFRYGVYLENLFLGATATVVQRYWRGALARMRVTAMKELRIMNAAAVSLQAVLRGHKGRNLARNRVLEVMQLRAAIIIQSLARGVRDRERVRRIRRHLLETRSATIIAAGARGMLDRQKARELRRIRYRHRCAARIQAVFHGMKDRRRCRVLREDRRRHVAARTVQKVARGHFGREAFRKAEIQAQIEFEIKTEKAIILQTNYRQRLGRIRLFEAMAEAAEIEHLRNFYAKPIQRAVKCFVARARLKKRSRRVIALQSFARRWLAKRKTQRRRQFFAKDELYVAPYLLNPDGYAIPHSLNLRRPPRAKKSEKKQYRAEAKPSQIASRNTIPAPTVKQLRTQAMEDFQSAPRVKQFFSDLQQRDHSRARPQVRSAEAGAGTKKGRESQSPAPAVVPGGRSFSPNVAAGMSRDGSPAKAHASKPPPPMGMQDKPLGAQKGRLPPRFAKQRAKTAGEDEGKRKEASRAKQRPQKRGSDSERDSDPEELPQRPPPAPIPTPAHAPAAPAPAPKKPLYDKDSISPDPTSDDEKKEKKKKKDKKKDRDRSGSPVKQAPKPQLSEKEALVQAAFRDCKMGKYHDVEKALQQGVGVEDRFGDDDDTMLLVCARNGQKRIAKLLLRNRADINCVNKHGDSALHLAYRLNYNELGDYLRSKGADDKIRNTKGQTCFEIKK